MNTQKVVRLAEWQPRDPATLPPDLRAPALWSRLARSIGYHAWFIEGALLRTPQHEIFDRWEVVLHHSGQRAFLGDGHATRAAVDAFAQEHGLVVDHYGPPGLWPGSTVCAVMRVVDAARAGEHFGISRCCFVVNQPHRFMPPRKKT